MIKIGDTQKPATQNIGSQKLLDDIVNYWNAAGLCSLESSTSIKDEYIASFENYIESRVLSDIVAKYCQQIQKSDPVVGLDVGAGLGRFSIVLARYLKHVYAIEPARQLYVKLGDRCKNIRNISILNESLESLTLPIMADIAVVSGVLYLYNDEMLSHFMDKLNSHLRPGGIVIIRDFIVSDGTKKLRSSYVKGAYCYYRNSDYWRDVAEARGMNINEIFRSVPPYNHHILRVMALLKLNWIYSLPIVKKLAYKQILRTRKGNENFKSGDINTVFIILEKSMDDSL
jgi:SAM-dependent methyltransferase